MKIETAEGEGRDKIQEPAPGSSLPTWEECALRVENSEYIEKRVDGGGYGPDGDSLLATPIHRFIYEYQDADECRATWFRHRLELALEYALGSGSPAGPGNEPPAEHAAANETSPHPKGSTP